MAFGQAGFGAASAPRGSASQVTIEYVDRPGLLWLSIKNFLLGVVTLSIYRFWAKTNVRRHVWSSVRVNGEPLEYTGTGGELFLGALIILGALILPFVSGILALQFIFGPEHVLTILGQLVFLLLGFLLWGMAIYRARRYRLSRTLWRGIRGTLTGSSTSFSMLYFGAMLLRGITLGWSTPAMNLNIQERLIGDMKFGETPFRFSGVAGPLYARYALCWLATPFVLLLLGLVVFSISGLSVDALQDISAFDPDRPKSEESSAGEAAQVLSIFAIVFIFIIAYALLWTLYTAREMVLFAEYTKFDNAQFKLNATAASLVTLWLGNMFILLFTLGIGQPYVVQRMARYMADRLSVIGTVDIAAIQQSTATLDKRGEGLLDAFDVDGF